MKTGLIGLGAMGAHMARNLAKENQLQTIWNRTRSKATALANELDCLATTSPAELAQQCELVILCVSRDEDVLEMVNAIATSLTKDAIVIDTSTVSSATANSAADILQTHQVHFLDCPVSGGVEGAKHGTLAMMVGGDGEILNRARDTLQSIANNIVHMGATGSGQATKAVNQMMAAGINQAVTEALAFGIEMGLEMDKVVDVVSSGAAGNWFLEHRGKSMLAGKFEPGFKLALHHKDLTICQKMARQDDSDKAWPMIEMTLLHYQKLMQQGYGEEDISALFRLKRA